MLTIVKLTRTLYKLLNENRRFNLLFKDIDIHLESQIDVLQTQGKNSNQSVRLTVLISCFSLVFGLLFLGSNHQSGYFSTNMAHLLLVFYTKSIMDMFHDGLRAVRLHYHESRWRRDLQKFFELLRPIISYHIPGIWIRYELWLCLIERGILTKVHESSNANDCDTWKKKFLCLKIGAYFFEIFLFKVLRGSYF